jgi:hypothetical protein
VGSGAGAGSYTEDFGRCVVSDEFDDMPDIPDLVILTKEGEVKAINMGAAIPAGSMFIGGAYLIAKHSDAKALVVELVNALSQGYECSKNGFPYIGQFSTQTIFENAAKEALTKANAWLSKEGEQAGDDACMVKDRLTIIRCKLERKFQASDFVREGEHDYKLAGDICREVMSHIREIHSDVEAISAMQERGGK